MLDNQQSQRTEGQGRTGDGSKPLKKSKWLLRYMSFYGIIEA